MNKSLEQLENGTATEKVIVLKSIYKQGRLTLQPVFDPKIRWYMGVERLSEIKNKLIGSLNKVSLVVMEGYAFNPKHGRLFSIGELGGVIKMHLFERDISYYIVAPTP